VREAREDKQMNANAQLKVSLIFEGVSILSLVAQYFAANRDFRNDNDVPTAVVCKCISRIK